MSKSDFLRFQAQTTPHPIAMEISHAEGCYIYDKDQKGYLDFVAGVSACSLGHRHPKVVEAIKNQLDRYMHVMVYGEYIQKPALELTRLLAQHLPKHIDKTYLTNSGTEAIDGALKLARRFTGRSELIAAHRAYHGNTMGALSVMGYEERKQPFRPQNDYLHKVEKRCKAMGALLILDEIQPGFGRTGKVFGFENYNCTPDVVVVGKGLGGGMPIGAFSASAKLMDSLSDAPKLGHITTFGGHPVIAAAALATLKEITQSSLMQEVLEKEKIIRKSLKHPLIKEIRGKGLMLTLITPNAEITNTVVVKAMEEGLILFWLLYEPKAIRITPPLTISTEELALGCTTILKILDSVLEDC